MQSALHIDSDMPFLTLLNREEIEKQMLDERMNVGNTRAGSAEFGSSCDEFRLFCNAKFN